MGKSLFDINEEYQRALAELEAHCIANDTDEVPDEINDRLVINQDEMADKLESYWFFIKELKGDVETVKLHQKVIAAKKKAIENNIKKLEGYVGVALESYGEENKSGNMFYKHLLFKVTATRSKKLSIIDANLVPDKYKTKKTIIETTIDTKALKKDLETEGVEGATIDRSTIGVVFR